MYLLSLSSLLVSSHSCTNVPKSQYFSASDAALSYCVMVTNTTTNFSQCCETMTSVQP